MQGSLISNKRNISRQPSLLPLNLRRYGLNNSNMVLPPFQLIDCLGKHKTIAHAEETEPNTDSMGGTLDLNEEDMKQKRLMKNRQSSQKYCLKQQQHAVQLENIIRFYEKENAIKFRLTQLSKIENLYLRAENEALKQMFSAVSDDIIFKEAQCEKLKNERNELLKLYVFGTQQLQYLEKMKRLALAENFQHFNMGMNQPVGSGTEPFVNMNKLADPSSAGPSELWNRVGLTNAYGFGSGSDKGGNVVDMNLLNNKKV